jgi:hypothetical protein
MLKYRVKFYSPNIRQSSVVIEYEEKIIECRELSIRENCYTFWVGEYGETNRLIASYPIQYTIIEGLIENHVEGE